MYHEGRDDLPSGSLLSDTAILPPSFIFHAYCYVFSNVEMSVFWSVGVIWETLEAILFLASTKMAFE